MTITRTRDRSAVRPPTPAARAVALVACLVAICTALLAVPTPASAHPLSTTAVLLDVGPTGVTGQIQLPIDRLAIALSRPELTSSAASEPGTLTDLRQYVTDHLAVTDPATGQRWSTSVTGGRVVTLDSVDHLVFDVALTPPPGASISDLRLHYDAIVEHLVSHRIFVSVRPAGDTEYTAVGVLDWESQSLTVPAEPASATHAFLDAVRLGNHHIAEGADHLLFLVMLLLPAPLLARRGRWTRADNLRRQCGRIVHVVTAFAVGHSITLALAALGYLSAPTRLVESLIAVSIVVSAAHATRPLVRNGEVWIGAGFGLLHGLAFASLLGQLNLGRGSLVAELLGFNLGIELTQLIVVALIMPSLIALSRTSIYPAVQTGIAAFGIVLALMWLAERTTLIATNPLEPIATALVAHPFIVPAGLGLLAAAATSARSWRPRNDTTLAGRTSAGSSSSAAT